MRLIDADEIRKSIRASIDECVKWADEVEESEMYTRVSQSIGTFVECSLRIKNAPTVDVLEQIRAEIKHLLNKPSLTHVVGYDKGFVDGIDKVLQIIDKHTKGE